MNQIYRVILCAGLLLAVGSASAHGDLDARTADLSDQLQREGESVELLLQRGEIYRQLGEWQHALEGLTQAARIDPGLDKIQYYKGRILYQSGEYSAALESLRRCLHTDPEQSGCLLYIARSYAGLGMPVAASEFYRKAVVEVSLKTPDIYYEWSKAHHANQSERISGAVEILEEGIGQLGPLVSLVQRILEYDQQAGDPDSALRHLDLLPEQLKATPKWLAVRADLLRDTHDLEGAKQSYFAALETIDRFPESRRRSPAMMDLRSYLVLQTAK